MIIEVFSFLFEPTFYENQLSKNTPHIALYFKCLQIYSFPKPYALRRVHKKALPALSLRGRSPKQSLFSLAVHALIWHEERLPRRPSASSQWHYDKAPFLRVQKQATRFTGGCWLFYPHQKAETSNTISVSSVVSVVYYRPFHHGWRKGNLL